MKKTSAYLILKMILVVLLATGTGVCIVFEKYMIVSLLVLFIIAMVYNIVQSYTQTGKDMQRFVNAIRFNEFNISFKNSVKKGLDEDLEVEMAKAISMFNERVMKKESELNFYEILLNRIDHAIIAVNVSEEIIWINKIATDLLGRPHPRRLDDLAAVEVDLPITLRLLTPKDVQTIKIQDANNDIHLAIGVSSASIRGEQIRIFSLKDVQPLLDKTESDAWKKLIRILTHEMMNSITPIISLAETFSEQETDAFDAEIMTKAMQVIHRRSKSLVGFVNNYKQLSHIPVPQKTNFVVAEMIEDIYHLLKAQNILFTYDVNHPGMTITADRGQLEQVLINLIKNGAEAVESSISSPHIQVIVDKDEYQHPLIHVSDDGAGILPDVLDKIFIPFFTTKAKGSGIGLSMCRQIINAHGGALTVVSEPDQGSTFTIRL